MRSCEELRPNSVAVFFFLNCLPGTEITYKRICDVSDTSLVSTVRGRELGGDCSGDSLRKEENWGGLSVMKGLVRLAN